MYALVLPVILEVTTSMALYAILQDTSVLNGLSVVESKILYELTGMSNSMPGKSELLFV